jgi:hypothetical protein
MRFVDLYNFANSQPGDFVSLPGLAHHICAHHPHVGEINFYYVTLDQNISLGHMVYERDRDSPYEGEFTVANVRLDRQLNRCWRRYVGTKELMHVFDSDAEKVDTREKFVQLMKEFETPPRKDDMSPMYTSEFDTQWMAVAVLCPQRLRDKYRPLWLDKTMSDYDVALALRIPEAAIKSLMGAYFEKMLPSLLAK